MYDAECAARTAVAGLPVGEVPPWGHVATSLEALAGSTGLPADELARTVARFNAGAASGVDPEHGRGRAPAAAVAGGAGLAPLTSPPFAAVPVLAGTLGTSGGLVTDAAARVLDPGGRPVAGLLAAGNVATTLFAGSYPGGGASLALAVARAFAAGTALADPTWTTPWR